MRVTKYGHACLFVEEGGKRLVIDPGGLTELPADLDNITAVVVTHIHFDHLDKANLSKIISANPQVSIVGSKEVADEIDDLACAKITVEATQNLAVGGFELKLNLGDHAVVYQKVPCLNLAVTVNDKLYYPGDSFWQSETEVAVVAVPLNAPWAKAAETIDFAMAAKAQILFPTHNGLLNDAGHQTYDSWLAKMFESGNKQWRRLKNGETLEL